MPDHIEHPFSSHKPGWTGATNIFLPNSESPPCWKMSLIEKHTHLVDFITLPDAGGSKPILENEVSIERQVQFYFLHSMLA